MLGNRKKWMHYTFYKKKKSSARLYYKLHIKSLNNWDSNISKKQKNPNAVAFIYLFILYTYTFQQISLYWSQQ